MVAGPVLLAAVVVLLLLRRRGAKPARADAATAGMAAELDRRNKIEESMRTREQELATFTNEVTGRLRGPLRDVTSTLAVAEEQLTAGDIEAGTSLVSEIRRRCGSLERLVTDLYLYANISDVTVRFQQVDLMTVVTAVLQRLEAQRPGSRTSVQVDPLPEVLADAAMLGQLLERLIGNALTFTSPGAAPRVRVRADLTGASWRGEEWRIEVIDQGIGVPDVDKSYVFEPFRFNDGVDSRVGNRVSLAMCRKIAMRHGGAVGVDDTPGGGSTFWFTIPLRQDRRRHSRIVLAGRVALESPSGNVSGALGDISEGGLRFTAEHEHDIPPGSLVDLTIEVGSKLFRQRATLLESMPGTNASQVRVQFIDAGPALVATIRAAAGSQPAPSEAVLLPLQAQTRAGDVDALPTLLPAQANAPVSNAARSNVVRPDAPQPAAPKSTAAQAKSAQAKSAQGTSAARRPADRPAAEQTLVQRDGSGRPGRPGPVPEPRRPESAPRQTAQQSAQATNRANAVVPAPAGGVDHSVDHLIEEGPDNAIDNWPDDVIDGGSESGGSEFDESELDDAGFDQPEFDDAEFDDAEFDDNEVGNEFGTRGVAVHDLDPHGADQSVATVAAQRVSAAARVAGETSRTVADPRQAVRRPEARPSAAQPAPGRPAPAQSASAQPAPRRTGSPRPATDRPATSSSRPAPERPEPAVARRPQYTPAQLELLEQQAIAQRALAQQAALQQQIREQQEALARQESLVHALAEQAHRAQQQVLRATAAAAAPEPAPPRPAPAPEPGPVPAPRRASRPKPVVPEPVEPSGTDGTVPLATRGVQGASSENGTAAQSSAEVAARIAAAVDGYADTNWGVEQDTTARHRSGRHAR